MTPGAPPRRGPAVSLLEGAVTAIAGGALGASGGSLVDLTVPAAVVAALNGAVGGARGVYSWRRPQGWVAWALDSTWALPMTITALVAHATAAVQPARGGYVAELSRRHDRHVYARGFRLRRGFAITLGNTINQAGDEVLASSRRRRLIADHEDVHVWQGRWLGPLYPVLYVGWSVLGGALGLVVWATRRRHERVGRVVETCSYYLNPLEWWAYSRDGLWPPRRMVAGLGWRHPVVRPFAATRRAGRRGGTPPASGSLETP